MLFKDSVHIIILKIIITLIELYFVWEKNEANIC